LLRLADSWIWDSWYAYDGALHHVFYLRASRGLGDPDRRHRHPSVGHAVSADLRDWTVLPDALAVSDFPAFDDWTTWTGSVVRDDAGQWRMFYTGTTRQDGGGVQRVGIATSADLLVWHKHPPHTVLEADPRWYEKHGQSAWPEEAWRDPFVFRGDDGQWHMYVTARAAHGDWRSRGVVGHCTSTDLEQWHVRPPLTEPGAGFGHIEVVQAEVVDGTPTLIFSCASAQLDEDARRRYGSGGIFSVTGPSLHGPFDISTARLFPDTSLYAGRLVRHDGRWHLMAFRDLVDGRFVGELIDPVPVTSTPDSGLMPAVDRSAAHR
jgi:beta-fructofuranosidase